MSGNIREAYVLIRVSERTLVGKKLLENGANIEKAEVTNGCDLSHWIQPCLSIEIPAFLDSWVHMILVMGNIYLVLKCQAML